MFPKSIEFSVQPRALQQAVDALPEPKGRLIGSSSTVADIRSKLLQVPTDKLRQWKMKASMLEKMPYLASEIGNAELRERVLAISVNAMAQMSQSTLLRLIPFLYTERAFIEALNARFLRQPPSVGPLWILDFWKAFRKPNPVREIAVALIEEGCSLSGVQTRLSLLSTNQILRDVLDCFVDELSLNQLKEEAFLAVLHCCKAQLSQSSRQKVLRWLLTEYCPEGLPLTAIDDDSALRRVLALANDCFTIKTWSMLPSHICTLKHILDMERKVLSLLSQGNAMNRAQWWRRWIRCIDEIHVHRPSGKVFITLGEVVCVESLSVPLWINIYSKKALLENIQDKIWQAMPFNITIPSVEKQRHPGWQLKFDDWMRSHSKGRPERW